MAIGARHAMTHSKETGHTSLATCQNYALQALHYSKWCGYCRKCHTLISLCSRSAECMYLSALKSWYIMYDL